MWEHQIAVPLLWPRPFYGGYIGPAWMHLIDFMRDTILCTYYTVLSYHVIAKREFNSPWNSEQVTVFHRHGISRAAYAAIPRGPNPNSFTGAPQGDA
jgi:hypothetical protein